MEKLQPILKIFCTSGKPHFNPLQPFLFLSLKELFISTGEGMYMLVYRLGFSRLLSSGLISVQRRIFDTTNVFLFYCFVGFVCLLAFIG